MLAITLKNTTHTLKKNPGEGSRQVLDLSQRSPVGNMIQGTLIPSPSWVSIAGCSFKLYPYAETIRKWLFTLVI